jgi:hypothetical protein
VGTRDNNRARARQLAGNALQREHELCVPRIAEQGQRPASMGNEQARQHSIIPLHNDTRTVTE